MRKLGIAILKGVRMIELEKYHIMPWCFVTVTETNHVVEVQYMEKCNNKCNIKKIDKYSYIDLGTGEVREFDNTDNRSQGYNSLRQTLKNLRYLINNNFVGASNELFITLTYGRYNNRVKDVKILYDDYSKFMKRLRYEYRDKTTIDYINVVEPQGDGTWHCHVLLKFNDLDYIYIPNKFDENNDPVDAPLYDLWGQGWVSVKRLTNVDNIGAYLTSYLTDIELNDDKQLFKVLGEGLEIIEKEVEGKCKKFIKGGRLHMYPSGINLYRKSRGIIAPERKKMRYKDIKQIVGSRIPNYSKKHDISVDGFENVIIFQQYNLKR